VIYASDRTKRLDLLQSTLQILAIAQVHRERVNFDIPTGTPSCFFDLLLLGLKAFAIAPTQHNSVEVFLSESFGY
jgi:hypothetical protein